MVLQEEKNLNNGGRREKSDFLPKKHKANKIPQRGLGIAALEKLRREELEQSTKTSFFGSSPLVWNSVQIESSSNSRKPQEGRHRCSLVMRNFLSPPLSSGASFQIEPPSNQSYVSINPPSMPLQKRSWVFQPGSAQESGNKSKRIALSSSSCSRVNVKAEAEASKLDGSLLSLGHLPVSEPSSKQTVSFHEHNAHNLQHIQKNTEENMSEAIGPPTFYNFMGLPHDLIESSLSEADTESKTEYDYRLSLK